jgi:prolyl-tRNA editing enzyme YbaK/EbsC (Cys-tRNA(Pro) deacylase)
VLVDEAVANHPGVVIGSGVRHSKLALSGAVLAGLKTAEVLRLAL